MPSSIRNVPFFALTTAGLEMVSAHEIAQLPDVTIKTIGYRRISAEYAGSLAPLLDLRTVDDVFLDCATWDEIGRLRSNLERLRQLAAQLDLHAAAECCARLRAVGRPATFSVTVSFVGRRNYSSEEIKAVLARQIAHSHSWHYQPDDRLADLNVRLFLEHTIASVGMRLSKTALHDRWYQRVHLPGALKPAVAAALVQLAQVKSGSLVLDPCCGSGTILIEAALQGAVVCGGDSSEIALNAACTNLCAAGVTAHLQRWDAQELPLPTASIDRIICNLPWGRQVSVEPATVAHIIGEMRRVLTPTGRMVLLTNTLPESAEQHLRIVQTLTISLFGQRPDILVLETR